MPTDIFHKKNSSGWISILTNDLDMIEESYFKIWFSVFNEIFEFVISLIFLTIISSWLTLFVLLTTILQMTIPKVMSKIIGNKKEEQSICAEEFITTTTDHLNGFDMIKSFQVTAKSLQAISNSNSKLEQSRYKVRLFTSLARLLSFTSGQIIYIGIYFFGAILVIKGNITVGELIAASQLVVYIASPLQTLTDDITEVKSAQNIIKNLKESIEYKENVPKKIMDMPKKFEKINIKNLTFSYENNTILKNVCFSLERGKKYLLCGESGTGKSTLINILTGIFIPEEGQICVDGTDIKNFSMEQYSKFILPCTQNIFIFNASIKDNVTLFNDKFSDEEVKQALIKSELGYLIKNYSDGINHTISQNGHILSGGERQKIALARMELYNPPVVIFDESFANIDYKTTKKLVNKIIENKERTVILVGHQLSDEIMKNFDNKILINNKSVILEG